MADKSTDAFQRLYWDSSVFLCHLNAENDKGYLDAVRGILEEARRGRVRIYTSQLTTSEVAFMTADLNEVPAFAHEREIDALWHMQPAIIPVGVTSRITEDARRMRRWQVQVRARKIGMMDMLHLATAMYAEVAEIHTTEDRWDDYGVFTGIRILRPTQHVIQGELFPPP